MYKILKINRPMLGSKLKKLYFICCLYLFNRLAFALATGALPSEITTNTNAFESGLAWAFKIGGMGAIIYGAIAFARNKLQGQAADQVALIILGLGAGAFAMGWWLGQSASSSAGFAF